MNISKSKFFLKGLDLQQFVQSLGLKFALKIKYLGVMIGQVTEKDIYASAVSKSFIRAQLVRDLDLTRSEKVQLLKVWIYPLWILPARVCYPSKQIIQQMCTTVQTALGIDSWGLTLKEFGHSFQQGGFVLVLPRNFLLFHHSSLFLHFLCKPHHFAPQCAQTFDGWADSVGLSLELAHLPSLQMGLVPWESLNMTGLSCKAYSQLRKSLPRAINEHVTVGDIPLQHSALFVNEHGYSYYSGRLAREGLVTVASLLDNPWKLGLFPPSYHASYSSYKETISEAQSTLSPIRWASVILQGSLKTFLPILISAQETSGRQPQEVWRSFNKLILPHSSKEFIRESLWSKLKVGDRRKSWLPGQRHCALCGDIETVSHALYNCKFFLLACDTISKCLGTSVHQMSQYHTKTLSSAQGLLLWAARQASWHVRNAVRLSHRLINATHFVKAWWGILQTWSELPGLGVNREEVRKFMTVLQSFLKTGQWLYTAVSRTRPSSPTPQQQKSHRRALRKLEQAERVRTLLHTLREEGREPIWTDGSSDRPHVGGS